jgi:hypothetical protein
MAIFANAHNKPMAIPEWADDYGTGWAIHVYSNWMKAHNVVAQSWFGWGPNRIQTSCPDSGQSVSTFLSGYPAEIEAYKQEWGGSQYTGSYWKYVPVN